MEYCGGGSLADYVTKKGAMPTRQVLEVAQQITAADARYEALDATRELNGEQPCSGTPSWPPPWLSWHA